MAVDWLKIKTEYINGHISYRKLAEKYGVSESSLTRKAISEGWKAEREAQRSKIEAKTQQKAVEKIADNEAEVIAIQSRLRLSIYQQIEKRIADTEGLEGAEFRRLVQSYKDMCDIRGTESTQEKDSPLAELIRNWKDD